MNDGVWNMNGGITLPNNANATHNIALSPLFYTKAGRGKTNADGMVTVVRGQGAYPWSTSSYPGNAVYFNDVSHIVSPSSHGNRNYPNSLRCLVSTNNRIMDKDKKESLVSDDEYTDSEKLSHSNVGVTLPDINTATHNAGLSPLFFAKAGRVYHQLNGYILDRSSNSFLWSANEAWLNAYILWVGINGSLVSPSHTAGRTWSFSLRCLVSTNNG